MIYFTPGPSKMYPTLSNHFNTALAEQIPSISHRGPIFTQMYESIQTKLRSMMSIPADFKIYFFASATEIWERILENCVNETSFHFDNGIFGYRFYWAAERLKKKPIHYKVPYGQPFDYTKIQIPENVELLAFTHNESSTGAMLDMNDIYTFKKKHPNMLTAVDFVSSFPLPEIDFKYVDLAYFSVQKGFGLPAGLGVCIISPQAFEKSTYLYEKGFNVGSYHNFQYLEKYHKRSQLPETPNVMNMYLLNKILDDFMKKTLETVRKETDEKAKKLYDFFNRHEKYKPFIKQPSHRSKTIIVVETHGDSLSIVSHLAKKGYTIGAGYGELKQQHVRIANFPAHTIEEVEGLIKEYKMLKYT